jgi:hypothetical protein
MFWDWGTLTPGSSGTHAFSHNLGVIPSIFYIISQGSGDFTETIFYLSVNGSSSSSVFFGLAPDAAGNLLGGITIEYW